MFWLFLTNRSKLNKLCKSISDSLVFLIAEKTHSRVGITQPGYYGDIEEVRRSSFHYPLLRQEVSGAGPCPQRSQDTQKTLTSFSQSTKVHFHPREGLIMKQRIIWVGLKRQKSSCDEVEGPTKHDDGEADWKKNWPRRKLPLMSNWAPWLPDARQMTNWPNLAQTKHTETNQMRLVGSPLTSDYIVEKRASASKKSDSCHRCGFCLIFFHILNI